MGTAFKSYSQQDNPADFTTTDLQLGEPMLAEDEEEFYAVEWGYAIQESTYIRVPC